MNLKAAYDLYMRNGVTYWSDSTYCYYQKNIGFFIEYLNFYHGNVEHLSVDLIDRDLIRSYITYLRNRKHMGKKIKSNTVRTYMRAVKAFLSYLYENEILKSNVFSGIKLPRPDDKIILPLLCDEVKIIDDYFDSDNVLGLRNKCIFHLMLDAGLRCKEVINLNVNNICFERGIIVILNSKANKSRSVILCPFLACILKDYIKLYRPDDSLFFKSNGVRITRFVIDALFRSVKSSCNIKRVHAHLLRHTFATSYIFGGGNLESLRLLLGHYDYEVTRRYLHLANESKVLMANIYRLDSCFFKSGY